MRIDRVIFTGDIFRTSESRELNQIGNVLWLRRLVGDALTEASGLVPSIWFGRHEFEESGDWSIRRIDHAFFEALGAGPSQECWAKTYFSEPNPRLISLIGNALGNAFIVAIEMSPLLQAVFDRLGLPWVDINISPIRFLPDMCL